MSFNRAGAAASCVAQEGQHLVKVGAINIAGVIHVQYERSRRNHSYICTDNEHLFVACSNGLFVMKNINHIDFMRNDSPVQDYATFGSEQITHIGLSCDTELLAVVQPDGMGLILKLDLIQAITQKTKMTIGWSSVVNMVEKFRWAPANPRQCAVLNDSFKLFLGCVERPTSTAARNDIWFTEVLPGQQFAAFEYFEDGRILTAVVEGIFYELDPTAKVILNAIDIAGEHKFDLEVFPLWEVEKGIFTFFVGGRGVNANTVQLMNTNLGLATSTTVFVNIPEPFLLARDTMFGDLKVVYFQSSYKPDVFRLSAERLEIMPPCRRTFLPIGVYPMSCTTFRQMKDGHMVVYLLYLCSDMKVHVYKLDNREFCNEVALRNSEKIKKIAGDLEVLKASERARCERELEAEAPNSDDDPVLDCNYLMRIIGD